MWLAMQPEVIGAGRGLGCADSVVDVVTAGSGSDDAALSGPWSPLPAGNADAADSVVGGASADSGSDLDRARHPTT
ncbi:MAG: hypothetical protein FWD73_16185 [Polyangiaceae bacterium]|nr:hypothetical protein [Polyangiaceae bacterium]